MRYVGIIIVVILAAVAFSAFFAWIAAMLWNGIVVSVFGAPQLTFLQMWGIIFLINLVFGGLRASTNSSE